MIENARNILQVEQTLAKKILLITDRVEAHFKPLDGELIKRADGSRTAKFRKAVSAFYTQCAVLLDDTRTRVTIDTQFNVWLTVDTHQDFQTDNPHMPPTDRIALYRKQQIWVGEIKNRCLVYEFSQIEAIARCNKVLDLTYAEIMDKAVNIRRCKAEIDALEASVPYSLRDALNAVRIVNGVAA